jgi:predicted transcriptional regulator
MNSNEIENGDELIEVMMGEVPPPPAFGGEKVDDVGSEEVKVANVEKVKNEVHSEMHDKILERLRLIEDITKSALEANSKNAIMIKSIVDTIEQESQREADQQVTSRQINAKIASSIEKYREELEEEIEERFRVRQRNTLVYFSAFVVIVATVAVAALKIV